MSNGEVCCILGVCCPPDSRKTRVVPIMSSELGLTEDQAGAVFDWFDSRVDFAPKGLVQPLIDHVADQARTHAKE